ARKQIAFLVNLIILAGLGYTVFLAASNPDIPSKSQNLSVIATRGMRKLDGLRNSVVRRRPVKIGMQAQELKAMIERVGLTPQKDINESLKEYLPKITRLSAEVGDNEITLFGIGDIQKISRPVSCRLICHFEQDAEGKWALVFSKAYVGKLPMPGPLLQLVQKIFLPIKGVYGSAYDALCRSNEISVTEEGVIVKFAP
ncbi:unnamed protein product, partial [marine sediment metagenome]